MANQALQLALVGAKDCDEATFKSLQERLSAHNVGELRSMAKSISVRLTGVSRKADIVERILSMARLGCAVAQCADSDFDLPSLSYLTDEAKEKLKSLPKFSDVDLWTKTTRGCLADFTFMNLLVYLVYGRDKTFDMDSMRAYKSLKAYKYFHDGFVKNVWLHDCKTSNPRIVYVRGYVQHSLTMDLPLEVFVALDGDTGDVFSAQCNCVSG